MNSVTQEFYCHTCGIWRSDGSLVRDCLSFISVAVTKCSDGKQLRGERG